jgi:hypothetical protein
VCAGDYDDDGRIDLYVTNWGTNFLFRNAGDGSFSETAARAGVQAGGWSTGCAFFDADADGDLDLYVARYVSATWDDVKQAQRTLVWRGGPKVMLGPAGLPGEADLFFENQGDGTFREKGAQYGLVDAAKGYGFGVVATDYDGDGNVDLYVANDSNPNLLFRNLGGRRFESVGLPAGVALNADGRAQAGMGSTPAITTATAGRTWSSRTSRTTATRCIATSTAGCSRTSRCAPDWRPRRSSAWAGESPSPTWTTTAISICCSRTATSIRTSTSSPTCWRASSRRASCS